MTELGFEDLKSDVDEACKSFPIALEDQKFTYWFFKAYITEDDDGAKRAVCGGSKDRGIDGIFIDERALTVFLVQSKYRKSINLRAEPDSEIKKFTNTLARILSPDFTTFREFIDGMEGATAALVRSARNRILSRGFSAKLIYVTTGKSTFLSTDFAKKRVNSESKMLKINAEFSFLDGSDVIRLLRDYRHGVAPPIPEVELELEKDSKVVDNTIFHRNDKRNNIGSWLITMSGDKVGDLYNKFGVRIFARNIRGFLGTSAKSINRKIEDTLKGEPDKFYYYNNGITMICDSAKPNSSKSLLKVTNAQIINGQQTTRVLANAPRAQSSKVGIMVKVVQVPRLTGTETKTFDELVSKIVAGTNRQNSINQSDLISNDRIQIELERNLRPRGYIYLRKKQSKNEAKKLYGNFGNLFINKDEFAKASAATQFDQYIVRSGVNHLYENHTYERVFPSSDPLFYLPRYHVMRLVGSNAKGRPEWSYAKWMITGFIWDEIKDGLDTNKKKQALILSFERKNNPLIESLEKLCSIAMQAAGNFYRINSGKGVGKLDHSRFYRDRKGRNEEFRKFWNSTQNSKKTTFRVEKNRFIDLLADL